SLATGFPGALGVPLVAGALGVRRPATQAGDLLLLVGVHRGKTPPLLLALPRSALGAGRRLPGGPLVPFGVRSVFAFHGDCPFAWPVAYGWAVAQTRGRTAVGRRASIGSRRLR